MENEEQRQQPLLFGSNRQKASSSATLPATEDDMRIDGVRDFCREFYVESKRQWYLAGPSIITSLCQYTIGTTTQAFVGQLGTLQLAALSIGSTISGFSYGIMLGMGGALQLQCGQTYGAGDHEQLGIYLQKSWIILNTVAVFMMFTHIFGVSILKLLGQTASISTAAGRYAIWIIPQLFANAIKIPTLVFLQAQSNVIATAVIAVVALIGHVFLSWLLIMKLGWGLAAAAAVQDGSWWFITVAQLLYVFSGSCGRTWSGFSWKAFQNLKDFVYLSFTTALLACIETWYVQSLVLLAGYFQEAEASIDALSICLNIMGWVGNIGLGLAVPACVRVANELGLARPQAARLSVIVAVLTSFLIGIISTMVVFVTRKSYPAYFTSSPEVRLLVEELTSLLGVILIATSLQVALTAVAIGAGWQKYVVFMSIGSYLLVGMPTSLLLDYTFDMGVKGLMYGLASGVSLQCCLVFIMVCRTNWNEEVNVAGDRIKQWSNDILANQDEAERTIK